MCHQRREMPHSAARELQNGDQCEIPSDPGPRARIAAFQRRILASERLRREALAALAVDQVMKRVNGVPRLCVGSGCCACLAAC